jgi:ABC-type transport system involved in multi-copper enzyme maturation permease subunit
MLAKEWRELLASRAFWILLLLIGPLVGLSFISAVRTYAELSGLDGTAGGVGEAFSPLIGVWAPTFSACELAAAFLLPFVAIRLVSGDRQSGALKLELQHASSPLTRILAKAIVLMAAWLVASIPPLIAIVLWRVYGGSIYVPELLAVAFGHLLNAALTIALGAATAAVAEHPSTAAILTLSVTVGTWIVNFVAAVSGGVWERVAAYTPTAMVAEFQHGLVRLSVVLVAAILTAIGLGVAAIWLRLGTTVRRRVLESAVLGIAGAALIAVAALPMTSWDTSENRGNSFSEEDERALESIGSPVAIDVHLAPEDPRRVDLDRQAIAKLRRVVPKLDVRYISATSVGLFEQTSPQYGEIWYDIAGRRTMSRVTTAEGVLEASYATAGISPPGSEDGAAFRGHPLAHPPRGAALVFYALWPAAVMAATILYRRRLA